ncbi:hypothetical protein [Methylobacterium sp. R2-1]|uniref:hypothetical protein n=1 Tax=Methylobacterium sp. R2-1 TaxID=2587064 RepID=UPI0016101E74|nr:hypothetical protein [Methylobacterium sp. R2-1]MBB2961497.1 hypothetical protein [Methylobacterium sp. R2-1]
MRASLLRFSLGLLCLGLMLPDEAMAARKAAPSRPAKTTVKTKVAQVDTKTPPTAPQTAWTAAEPANCGRVRRKLWQGDEGWIVKTVTVCH